MQIDVIVMPIQDEGGDAEFADDRKLKKQSSHEEKKQEPSSVFKKTINDIISTFLQNLQLSVDSACVRVVTREQTNRKFRAVSDPICA